MTELLSIIMNEQQATGKQARMSQNRLCSGSGPSPKLWGRVPPEFPQMAAAPQTGLCLEILADGLLCPPHGEVVVVVACLWSERLALA